MITQRMFVNLLKKEFTEQTQDTEYLDKRYRIEQETEGGNAEYH